MLVPPDSIHSRKVGRAQTERSSENCFQTTFPFVLSGGFGYYKAQSKYSGTPDASLIRIR
ncbi:hypothetical protein [Neisseria sicca]|uniref:hypothetical protein n=1 Tax=Neisseria sicca TaxID=490 RepID=UPI0011BD1922|nr:hypothetical protein [Neisseria sicca]